MEYEVTASSELTDVDEWRVEAVAYDRDGEVYVTIFSGPEAKERAHEYAAWKNRG